MELFLPSQTSKSAGKVLHFLSLQRASAAEISSQLFAVAYCHCKNHSIGQFYCFSGSIKINELKESLTF